MGRRQDAALQSVSFTELKHAARFSRRSLYLTIRISMGGMESRRKHPPPNARPPPFSLGRVQGGILTSIARSQIKRITC